MFFLFLGCRGFGLCSRRKSPGSQGEADPGVRLASASAAFGLPTPSASICDESYQGALRNIASTLSSMLSGNCLAAQPKDVEAATGLQTDCRVVDTADGGKGQGLAIFGECDEGSETACFTLESDAVACPWGPGLRIVIDRKGGAIPPGAEPVLYCTAE